MLRACVVSSELRTRVDAGGGGGDCEALRASGLCGFGLNWVAEGETREGEKVGTLSASCMGTFSGLILTVPEAIQRRKHLNFVLIMWLQRIICFNSFFKAFVCVFVELIDLQELVNSHAVHHKANRSRTQTKLSELLPTNWVHDLELSIGEVDRDFGYSKSSFCMT